MMKGVNKQVLEVTATESPYFERILFFVRPEGAALSEQELHAAAKRYSQTAQKPPKTRLPLRRKLQWSLYLLLGAGAGAALTVIFGYLA